jgi:tetratricopeptide (TPR) repeat protein
LAQARLVRGDATRALPELDQLIEAFPPPRLRRPPTDEAGRERLTHTLEVAAHAARVKGRWLLRAREDGKAALAHFGAMSDRFSGTPHRGHFLYWKATSLVHLSRRQEALEVLAGWRAEAERPLDALRLMAEFMVHHRFEGALEVCRELVAQAPDAPASYLMSRALMSNDELEAARAAARNAVERAPSIALYRNHLARLGAR